VIAALCDIHGNFAALQAVLAEIPDDAVIVVGGDIAAGGPEPRATVDCLQSLGSRVQWVRGNMDRALGDSANPSELLSDPQAIEHAREQLTPDQATFLSELPLTVELDGVMYCHASPRNELDIFTERTPEERVSFLFQELEADVVICGHTHLQFDRVIAGRRVINAGSVGDAVESSPGAYWLLDFEPRRTNYPNAPLPTLPRDEWLDWVESLPHNL